MSTISATATGGNASNPTTWGGATPGPNDDVVIPATAAVTVDAPLSVRSVTVNSTSGTAFGVLTVNSALNLTAASGVGILLGSAYNQSTCPTLLVIGPGGSVTGNPAAGNTVTVQVGGANFSSCGWAANGTGWGAGQSCAVTNAGPGVFRVTAPGPDNGSLAASYLTLTGLGSASADALQCYLEDPGHHFTLDHCRFVGCGQVNAQPRPNAGAVIPFRLNDVKFSGSPGSNVQVSCGTGFTGGSVTACVFDGPVSFSNCVSWAFPGCYFGALDANSFTGSLSATNTFPGCFFRQNPPNGVANQDSQLYGDLTNGYCFLDAPADPTHRHFWSHKTAGTVTGNVFEMSGTDGDSNGYIHQGPGPVTLSYNLQLPLRGFTALNDGAWKSGRLAALLSTTQAAGQYTIEHNTAGAVGTLSPFEMGDLQNPPTGWITSLRSNLIFGDPTRNTTGAVGFIAWNGHQNADGTVGVESNNVIANADYNATYALNSSVKAGSAGGTPYDLVMSYVPGANDVKGQDPRFVDPTRRLGKWGQAVYATDGTDAAALALLRADVTKIPALIAWVQGGFAPANSAYPTSYTGDAAQYRGAVAPPAPAGGPSGVSAFLTHLTDPLTGASGFPVYSLANLGPVPSMYGSEHYDPPRGAYAAKAAQVRRGTAASDWSGAVTCGLTRMGLGYFLPNGGGIQFFHLYNTGSALDYYNTGNLDSRDSALCLDPVYHVSNLPIFVTQETSRETAFSVIALIECEWMGRDHATLTEEMAAMCLGHMDQWTRPAGTRYYAAWLRPFMLALTCEALITYWERYRKNPDTTYVTTGPAAGWTQASIVAAIPGRVKAGLDTIWANDWLPAGTAYGIDTGPGLPATPTTPVPQTTTWPNGSFKLGNEDTFAGPLMPVLGSAVQAGATLTTFSGPAALSAQNDYFKYAWVRFRSPGVWAGYHGRIGAYAGATRTFTLDGFTGGDPSPPGTPPAAGDLFDLYVDLEGSPAAVPGLSILYTGGTGASPDLNHLIAPAFAWYYWWTKFNGTPDPSYRANYELVFNGGTMCWQRPSLQKQWNQAVRWGFTGLDWEARGDAEWPAAAAHTLAGPTPASGPANAPSDRIKVALPAGTLPAGTSVPSPVRVTFVSSTGRGSFVPAVAFLTNHRPYAMTRFVPDPLDAGANVTVTCTNDGGLTPPAGFAYAVTAASAVATGYRLTGPAAATAGVPFAVTLATVPAGSVPPVSWLRSGGGFLAATPGDGYAGGSYTINLYPNPDGTTPAPALAWVSAERTTQALSYKEPAAGTRSLTAPNSVAVAAPAALVVAVSAAAPAATSYTLTGPASGAPGVASGAFTVSLTPAGGVLAAAVTLRPGDGGAGGVFSPATVTLSTLAPSASFTYTPASAAAVTVSCGSGGALADPAPLTYTPVRAARPGRYLPRRIAPR